MSKTKVHDRLRAANPVRVGTAPDEALLGEILATPRSVSVPPRRTPARRGILIVASAVVAIAAPAVASQLGLLSFSSHGRAVARSSLSLTKLSALQRAGFGNGVSKLAERDGVAFYAGRGTGGGLCFATGPAGGAAPTFAVLACQHPGADVFPSAARPIVDFSPLGAREGSDAVFVRKLVGVAADGVAEVAVVGDSGVLYRTPVTDNVYVSDSLPDVSAQAIVALDPSGKTVYTHPLASSTPG